MSAIRIINTRYLRPLKLGRKSKKFYVFDTETGIIDKKGNIEYILSARPEHIIFGVIYGPDGFIKILKSPKEFKKEFKKRRYKNKIVYAHNAEYDLSAVYGNVYDLDRSAIFNGKFICATNGNCMFADSFNLLSTSVKKLGELLGIHKKELGEKLKSHIDNFIEDQYYCVRDCEIIYKSLENVFNEAEPSFTIGSLAMKIFRKTCIKNTIKINPLSDKFFDCYYGGRTEAFKIGECHAKVYDINSSYPYVMQEMKFPNPEKFTSRKNPSLDDTCFILENFEGMITATITIDKNEKLPVLPFRQNDRLIFPCGTFRGSWTIPEFNYALKVNAIIIKSVDEIIYSQSIQPPFKEYIKKFYDKRNQTKNDFERYYYKMLLNNLYGKFGQRSKDQYRYCMNDDESKKFMIKNKIKYAEIMPVNIGFFLRYEQNKLFQHTIACWASYVTSYGRIRLHEMMAKHIDKLIYCDTDSVFIEKDLRLNSTNLGDWKKEKKIVTNVRALKDYVYYEGGEKEFLFKEGEEKEMLKGVKKDAKKWDKESNVFTYNRMIKTRESFRRVDNLPPGTFINQTKVISGDYKKRTILKGGKTKPFIL